MIGPWFEPLLLSNRLAWVGGRLVAPLEPVHVGRPLRVGRRGTDVDLEWEVGRSLVISPVEEGLHFRWEGAKREWVLGPGEVWSQEGVSGPSLHVLAGARDSCGWPEDVAAPLGPWSDELLSVLGDSLLERGHPVGARLGARVAGEDGRWFPLRALVPPTGLEVTWRRGVMDRLTLRGAVGLGAQTLTWALGRSLAAHAVVKPVRALSLRTTFDDRNAVLRALAGLAAGGLPCLETLDCELRSPTQETSALQAFERELRGLPGVASGLPTLRTVRVTTALPLPR